MGVDFKEILKKYWGFEDFRGIQREIIESIYQGKDTLGLMPTGGGKSITFQVPAIAKEGICLVITPLIALMKDQVTKLRSLGIHTECIYSAMSHDKILTALENCIYGPFKFLYVSPERLGSSLFMAKLSHMPLSMITVDEAHCISQWGYDFRPSYLQIAAIRKSFPNVPVLALTATATPKVVDDIQDKLDFKQKNVIRMSFSRKNLSYIVQNAEDKNQEVLSILQKTQGPAIVYTRNRKKTRELAEWLTTCGIDTLYYHAGLDNTDRDIRQNMWQKESTRVIVATNAFGMGIDKANVRTVIHLDLPDSVEAYFQEAGRAGRDGQPAQAILLFNGNDKTRLHQRINERYPEKDYIRQAYEDLCCYLELGIGDGFQKTFEFNEMDFCTKFHYFPVPLLSSLKILTRAGYIKYREEEESTSRIMFLLTKSELNKVSHLAPLTEKILVALMRSYGGIFSEYVYIDEKLIAHQTETTQVIVYETLKGMNQQRILHYVPRKSTPYVTFTERRVETNEIALMPEVYETRKTEYAKRIEAVLNYAMSQDICRSRLLLEYFGEETKEDCGNCDVCREKNTQRNSGDFQKITEHAAEAVVNVLADGKWHNIGDLLKLPFDSVVLKSAISCLTDEEEIVFQNDKVKLA